jgi:hypothetical protein
MAAIHHVISLGIGTPAGIPSFLTFGLAAAVPEAPSGPSFIITQGIGTPAAIPQFLLLGLSTEASAGPFVPAWAINANTVISRKRNDT